jgi:Fe-S-cluster containining protein
MDSNPCITCGACCAHFRVSFYWGEAEDAKPDGVPLSMCDDLNTMYRGMKGTNCVSPRCIALLGDIGVQVACTIYERRSSVCRDFAPAWENGQPNPRCDEARLAYGLPPLTPEFWNSPDQPELDDPLAPAA